MEAIRGKGRKAYNYNEENNVGNIVVFVFGVNMHCEKLR